MKKILGFVVPILFFVSVLTFVNFGKVFEYETDEGLYLMRAYLCAKGYVLYKEVWMEQPPALVLMMAALFKIFGPSVYVARMLILALSTALIWAMYQIISKTQNTLSALLTCALIILSSFYIRLSVSVMGSIYAIAIAILSSYAIFLYRENGRKIFLLLSGGLFAAALLSRFFAVVFLPGILCEIAMIEKAKTTGALGSRLVRAYSFWIAALSVVFLYIAFVATSMDFSQLWQPYAMGRQMPHLRREGIISWFLDEWNLTLLVIGALIFSRREDRKFFFIPFISLVFGILIFTTHSPVWFYHRFYVIIPMCWLASFSFYALFQQIRAGWEKRREPMNGKSVIAILFLCITIVLYVFMLPPRYDLIRGQIYRTSPEYSDIVSLMKQYNKQKHMIVTDSPIFAFYADMPVFPYLVSSSTKRMYAGLLGEKDFLDAILKEKPEIILFARYPELHDKIVPYIQKDYELEYANPVAFQWLYISTSAKKRQ